MAHITGGGFVGNIPRMLPEGVAARIRKDSWGILPIFKLIQKEGNIEEKEMYQVFNMGIGITVVCSPQEVARIASILPEAKVIGQIVERQDRARITID
jgi:phosphoribosylformylglycinamidine cyclo-ligase